MGFRDFFEFSERAGLMPKYTDHAGGVSSLGGTLKPKPIKRLKELHLQAAIEAYLNNLSRNDQDWVKRLLQNLQQAKPDVQVSAFGSAVRKPLYNDVDILVSYADTNAKAVTPIYQEKGKEIMVTLGRGRYEKSVTLPYDPELKKDGADIVEVSRETGISLVEKLAPWIPHQDKITGKTIIGPVSQAVEFYIVPQHLSLIHLQLVSTALGRDKILEYETQRREAAKESRQAPAMIRLYPTPKKGKN